MKRRKHKKQNQTKTVVKMLSRILLLILGVLLFPLCAHIWPLLTPFLSVAIIGWMLFRQKTKLTVIKSFTAICLGLLVLISGIGVARYLVWENMILRHYFPITERRAISVSFDLEKISPQQTDFVLPVEFSNSTVSINTIQLVVRYDPKSLEISSVDMSQSVFPIVVKQTVDQKRGRILIVAGKPNPGISLESGHIAYLHGHFTDQQPASLKIHGSTQVLANDRRGTNVYLSPQRFQLAFAVDHIIRFNEFVLQRYEWFIE